MYINDIASKDSKVGTVTAAYLGIRWGRISSGLESPTENRFVKLALEGAKRLLASNTVKNQKEILTCEVINSIVNMFKLSSNLIELRSVLMYLLGFSGFMRIKELLALRLKDVTFTEKGMTLFIETSKTDQLREGSTIFISKSGKESCPVRWTKKYLDTANIKNPENYIICRLAKCKIGHKALGNLNISYTTALDNIRKILPGNINPKSIGTHSLRAGGASLAANKG